MSNQSSDQRRQPEDQAKDQATKQLQRETQPGSIARSRVQFFQRVVRDYPTGNKVPDAMLKTGLCYQNLGDLAQARQILVQVAEIYPGTRVAELALVRMQRIP